MKYEHPLFETEQIYLKEEVLEEQLRNLGWITQFHLFLTRLNIRFSLSFFPLRNFDQHFLIAISFI